MQKEREKKRGREVERNEEREGASALHIYAPKNPLMLSHLHGQCSRSRSCSGRRNKSRRRNRRCGSRGRNKRQQEPQQELSQCQSWRPSQDNGDTSFMSFGGANCLRRDKSETEAWTDSLNGKRGKESYPKRGRRTNRMHSLHAKSQRRRELEGCGWKGAGGIRESLAFSLCQLTDCVCFTNWCTTWHLCTLRIIILCTSPPLCLSPPLYRL